MAEYEIMMQNHWSLLVNTLLFKVFMKVSRCGMKYFDKTSTSIDVKVYFLVIFRVVILICGKNPVLMRQPRGSSESYNQQELKYMGSPTNSDSVVIEEGSVPISCLH